MPGESDDNTDVVLRSYYAQSATLFDGFSIVDGNASTWAGGMFNYHSNPTVTMCTFASNAGSTYYGGGMFNDSSSPTVTACTFSANDGPGMGNTHSSPTVTTCTFISNNGRGMANRYNNNVAVTSCTFSANAEAGIYSSDGSTTIAACTFVDNISPGSGGGICSVDNTTVVGNCTFENNASLAESSSWYYSGGGGIYNDGGSMTVLGCTFTGNTAVDVGGGVLANGGYLVMSYCSLSDNAAEALYVNGAATIANSMFYENAATGIIVDSGSAALVNCVLGGNAAYGIRNWGGTTIANCTFASNADGAIRNTGTLTIDNSIVWESIYDQSENCTVSCSCVRGGFPGSGNICRNPRFVDADGPDDIPGTADDDLRLQADSPCNNMGSDAAVPPDTADLDGDSDTTERTPVDLDGNPRFVGTVDMGAYEHSAPTTPPGVPARIYVDAAAAPGGDGLSWPTAYVDLQDALDVAEAGTDVWVAVGSYYPDRRSGNPGGTGDPLESFWLADGVAMYGGFLGGETSLAERPGDPDPFTVDPNSDSILSGDIGVPGESDDNVETVVRSSYAQSTAVVDGFSIIDGNATDWAGGIFNYHSNPTVTSCTLASNAGYYGGGMCNYGSSPTVTNCTFAENTSSGSGGGMFNRGSSNPTLLNCTFSQNYAESSGGAITNWSQVTLDGCNLSDNTSGGGGGGMVCNADATISNCTFLGNSADGSGGGILVDSLDDPPITMAACTFTDNTAGYSGGGIYSYHGIIDMAACTFTHNNAAGNNGGGLFAGGSLTAANCSFVGNEADNYGGGMFAGCWYGRLSECIFADNVSGSSGGGARLHGDYGYGDLCVTKCSFTGNTAQWDGGGAAIEYATMAMCTLRGNRAYRSGGGMYTGYNVTVANCLLSGNLADQRGGGIGAEGTGTSVVNCTLTDNVTAAGGGVYGEEDDDIVLANCILWNNAPNAIDNDATGDISVTYSAIEGGYAGTGNIDSDPSFYDPDGMDNDPDTWEDNDYHLRPQSPCIDAADNTSVPADEFDLDQDDDTTEPLPFDRDGEARFVDDPDAVDTGNGLAPLVDMGAYEYQPTLSGDCDDDDDVDMEDFANLADCLDGPEVAVEAGCDCSDLDIDFDVDLTDFGLFQRQFGTGIAAPPSITEHPESQTVCDDAPVAFSVVAQGTGTLLYQWRKDSVDISGAESDTYTISAATPADAGVYDVIVTDDVGSVTSNPATLTVNPGQPEITDQPDDVTVCAGGSATFSVTATGTGTLSYQWRFNSGDIPGATSDSYQIDPVDPNDAGTYDVVVTDDCGSVASDPATLTVNPSQPEITDQPDNVTVCAGSSAQFCVTATGTGTLSYQWRKGGVDLGGETAACLTIDPVDPNDAGTYDAVVTDDCGSVTSDPATLTVNPGQPIITDPPEDASACDGGDALFTISATGTGTLHYQWYDDGSTVGDDSDTLNRVGVTLGDSGSQITCDVTDDCGTATSTAATLTVLANTTITAHPQSQSICDGAAATFSVTAAGSNLSYQWRKDSVDIDGATSDSYTIDPVSPSDAGDYDVVVSGDCGSVTSDPATLAVNPGQPTITTQPEDASACDGGDAVFTIMATGSGTLHYQWYDDASPVGSDSDTLNLVSVTLSDNGSQITCDVTDDCGTATSTAATLTVVANTTITEQPQAQSVCDGSAATFTVTAAGSNLTYQWRKDSVDIGGATSDSYMIDPVSPSDAGDYDVLVSGDCGSVTSDPATLTVSPGEPVITTQPEDASACDGGDAVLTIVATGSGTLHYQWYDDGSPVGSDSDTLNLVGVMLSDNGSQITCDVTDDCGTATSTAATLTVLANTTITAHPQSQSICDGAAATFSVTAAGSNLTYQWRKDSVDIGGATSDSYTIDPVSPSDAGDYDVAVTGDCGSLTSDPATLTVSPGQPAITDQPDDAVACEGDSVQLCVTATGTGTVGYQWRKGGAGLSGETAACLTIDPVDPNDAGSYDVVVTDDCGSVTSDVATLTVYSVPSILESPESRTVLVGDPVTFSVSAQSSLPLTYQWRMDGINIDGATGDEYTIDPVVADDAGDYDVIVENDCGAVTSDAATLTVLTTPPDLLVASFNTHSILRYDGSTGAFVGAFVSSGSGGLAMPITLTYGPDDNLYVSSYGTAEIIRYDGETGAYVGTFVSAGSGGLIHPNGKAFGPDGDLYVVNGDGRVLRYDGQTGAFVSEFVGTSGGLSYPLCLVFGPDDNLYVTDYNQDQVRRYDGSTGAFIDVFVDAGVGSLSDPNGLAFGPDGMLYVSNNGQSNILRFDGTTGAFIDVFIPSGSGGMSNPGYFEFAPNGDFFISGNFVHNVLHFDGDDGSFVEEFVSPGSGGLDRAIDVTFMR